MLQKRVLEGALPFFLGHHHCIKFFVTFFYALLESETKPTVQTYNASQWKSVESVPVSLPWLRKELQENQKEKAKLGPLAILVELEFRVLVFVEGGKLENPEKNPRSKATTNNKRQPTYGTRQVSNPGHTGGRQVLSPLRHACSTGVNQYNQSVLEPPL